MKYTHIDSGGMAWRFEGSRPVSALADSVVESVLEDMRRERLAKRRKTKPKKGHSEKRQRH